MKKIGEILLDSGVLLLGDLVEIKKIDRTPHSTQRIFVDTHTRQVYQQGIAFDKFTDILLDNKSVNQLLAEKVLEEVMPSNASELSSENILSDLEKGFKQIKFENGTDGKAFAVLSEEGFYAIYAETDEKGISKLIIDFRAE